MADINPTQQPGSSTTGNNPLPGGQPPNNVPTPPTPAQPAPASMEPSRGPLAGDLPNLPLHDPSQTMDIGAPENVETPTDEDGDDD